MIDASGRSILGFASKASQRLDCIMLHDFLANSVLASFDSHKQSCLAKIGGAPGHYFLQRGCCHSRPRAVANVRRLVVVGAGV